LNAKKLNKNFGSVAVKENKIFSGFILNLIKNERIENLGEYEISSS